MPSLFTATLSASRILRYGSTIEMVIAVHSQRLAACELQRHEYCRLLILSRFCHWHVQVGQVLLTLPSSFAATGLAVGILFQLAFATAALWTLFMLAGLYQEFRKQRQLWRRDLHHGIIMVMTHACQAWVQFAQLCVKPRLGWRLISVLASTCHSMLGLCHAHTSHKPLSQKNL